MHVRAIAGAMGERSDINEEEESRSELELRYALVSVSVSVFQGAPLAWPGLPATGGLNRIG